MRLFHPLRWLRAAKRIVRRGRAAAPIAPSRRRVVLLQIDGLSSRRLLQALARGDMPHLARWLDSGQARLACLHAASPPSTPVFTAGLLYGARDGVPGFGWYDRALGRQVRMDLAEDVSAVEAGLAADRRPLLDGGTSYGTIWPGGADDAFFNVVLFNYGATSTGKLVRNAYDKLVSTAAGAVIAGRVASRFALELGVGLWDFVRWCRRIHSTRFEWRFLYMRLFVSVVMRDVSTQAAVVDILRGVPRIFIDYLGYDEYAHRRGPDSELALYNLAGTDAAIAKIFRAVRAVPEYNYDVFVFSDHGQLATIPFERVVGRELRELVLEHARVAVGGSLSSHDVRELVSLRATEFWTRTLPKGLRGPARLYVEWLRRRVRRRADDDTWRPLDAIEVVTGGSIANIYFDRGAPTRLTLEELDARYPELVDALERCPAVGLMVARGAGGPIVMYRGGRWRLGDRRALERLEPFRRLGFELAATHLLHAAEGERYGDLVLYGAFAAAGDVSFDFEFGSHGGIAPEELDQFVLHPAHIALPPELRDGAAVVAEQFYRFFAGRYGDRDEAPASEDAA
ncbi:MAG TPA: alkaline phosphatase family protein [Polyangia bacterium]